MINSRCLLILLCSEYFFVHSVNAAALRDHLYQLDIIHYNDFHDRFEETTVNYPICTKNDNSCLGGFARLYREIMTLLKEKPDALLLDAGDSFQGTYWYTLLKWNVTQHFINMLPNDAHAIGNHEFDDGVEGIAPYLAALQAPVIAANIDTSKEPMLNGLYQPHIIIEKRGRRVGIIGLITPDTKILSNPRDVIFLDPINVVQKEAKILTDQGVDIIVVLSHCGLETDKKIAETVGDNIDIIVGGHSHSLLWNSVSPSNEFISGPYPVIVETESRPGHKVLIVTASAYSKYLGNLTVHFDRRGEVVSFDGNPVFLNRSIPEDPRIKRLLVPYKQTMQKFVNEVVGHTDYDFSILSCDFEECALGNLIVDSFVDATKEISPSNLTNVGFLLKSMIRGSMAKGDITRGSILNTSPFTNKVVTLVVYGRQIMEAIERCVTQHWMPQVAGMQVTLNLTSHELVSVLVKENEGYQPLDLNKHYQLTTPYFLVRFDNGFTMFQDNIEDVTHIGKDAELIEKYIRKVSPISNYLDNRLVVLK